MASRTLAIPLRRSTYVCDSCLYSARSARITQAVAPRAFSTASSRALVTVSQRTSQRIDNDCRTRGTNGTGFALTKCLAPSSRPYSTKPSQTEVVTSGIAILNHRRLIKLHGPDAAKFLQGLITNNVDSTRVSPFYSAFLDARGRVLFDVFIWVWPELVAKEGQWACYIEVGAGEMDLLMKHLKRHKLRSKLEINGVGTEGPNGIHIWAAWGGAHEQVKDWSSIAGMEDPRAPGMYRYLANADRETIAEGLQSEKSIHYNVQRYIHGVPEGPRDIPREAALPMEVNIDLNGGIDFKKGCYVGQELTIRTKHTGVVRKRILPVLLHRNDTSKAGVAERIDPRDIDLSFEPQDPVGADIKQLDENGAIRKGRAAGKIIGAYGNVGLAACRLENMTPMKVTAEGGTYKEGMQFGIEVDGQVVRVQPVLYDWFVKRKEALWDREERKKAKNLEEQEELD